MTQESVRISIANGGHISDVCHIMRQHYLPSLLRGTIYESPKFDKYLADRYHVGDLFLLATVDGNPEHIIGFAQVLPMELTLHVNHLVVRKSLRGLGIGGTLMDNIISRARTVNKNVTLDVHSKNVSAIRLYRKIGFNLQNTISVARIERESGRMPMALVEGNAGYRKYGFCYIEQSFSWGLTRVGVVGLHTIRLNADDIAPEFEWSEFVEWARWADVFVFGRAEIDPWVKIRERWSVLRMVC